MSVIFHSWQRDTPREPFTTCSPNLLQLRKYLLERWGLTNLGCYGRRPIRGGTAWSSHAFGAAHDYSYREGPDRSVIEGEVIPWLIDNFELLGIQRVHDYWARRYWQAGRGWIERPPGAKNDHLHIEVTPDTWGWDTPIEQRLKDGPPAAKPAPKPAKPAKYPGKVTKRGSTAAARVRAIQQALNDKGHNAGPVDGSFGPMTEAACKRFQTAEGLEPDGLVGPKTWAALFGS